LYEGHNRCSDRIFDVGGRRMAGRSRFLARSCATRNDRRAAEHNRRSNPGLVGPESNHAKTTMKAINNTLKTLLLVAAVFALAEAGLFFHDMRSAAKETTATMAEAKAAVSELRTYSREQLARLRDPRNSKAIDAAIQTAAVFNGTGRLINTQLIPQAMKTLDGLAESIASLNRMIQATDHSVNAEIAPEAVRSLQSGNAALKELSTALEDASGLANASLDDIHRLLSDPAWAASLNSIQSTTENISEITAELEKASEQMPEITKSINQIASTSSLYRRWILLSQIFSAVARTFF
jgi:hypothetical protein